MTPYDLHICLVGQQPLPNLIPALPSEGRPRDIVLLVSDGKRDQASLLRRNFEQLGCRVEEVEIHPYRIENIRAKVFEVLSRHDGKQTALNVTGATKIMSFGAAEVFRALDRPVFYVDTENAQFITLYPQTGTEPLPDLVKVKTYLSAHGYEIKQSGSCQIPPDRQKLCDHLVANAPRYTAALTVLNACAAAAEKKNPPWAKLEDRHQSFAELQDLLTLFSDAGLVHLSRNQLYFSSEDARRFAGGGWLEDHVIRLLNRLKGEKIVHDHMANVVVETQAGVRNEIDVAFTARNRLHLIECKSGRLSEKEGKENRADAVAYKLDNIRDLTGGTYGKAMLVSFQKLIDADRKRCAENHIEVVECNELIHLETLLKQWVQGARRPRRTIVKGV